MPARRRGRRHRARQERLASRGIVRQGRGAFSFYPGKNLGACGEAGAVTTDDEQVARTIGCCASTGRRRSTTTTSRDNGRLDAIQAAFLRIKLRHLDDGTPRRRAAAALRYGPAGVDCRGLSFRSSRRPAAPSTTSTSSAQRSAMRSAPGRAPQLQHVAEPARGDEGGARAVALEDGVGHDRGGVRQ